MKIVEACLKLYYDKDHHTNSNTKSQPGDVDNSVIPVSDQTTESGFEIIFEHKQVVLSFKSKGIFTSDLKRIELAESLFLPVKSLFYPSLPALIQLKHLLI